MNTSRFSFLTFTGLISCAVAFGIAGCGDDDGGGGGGSGGEAGGGGSATGGSGTGGSNTGGSNTGGSNTGGSNTGGSNTGGSGTGGSGTGGSGTGGSGTGGSGTGGSGTGGAGAVDSGTGGMMGGDGGDVCQSYCDTILVNCTGMNEQYMNEAECLQACAGFDTSGMATDYTGDTLQCRVNHLANTASLPDTHCDHAGPTPSSQCI